MIGKNPLDFVGLSALRWDGDKAMQETFNTTELGWETHVGTVPEGSTWRKVPIPSGIWTREGPQFEPVCQESEACIDATRQGALPYKKPLHFVQKATVSVLQG
jgi:hypothetical protein